MPLFARTVARALARLGLEQLGGSPFPRPLRPMLAMLGRTPFDDPAFVYEPKWDGFRVIAMMRAGSVQLLSRNLHPFTNLFRPITEALKDFPTSLVLAERS